MQEQKFSHLRSGKALGITLIILQIALIGVGIALFISSTDPGFRTLISSSMPQILRLLTGGVVTIGFMFLLYRFYKPGFTDVIFSTKGIISRTPFEQQELSIDNIKGIWYFRQNECENIILKPYSKQENLKGCIVVIGDRNRFLNVETVGMGFMMLKDAFNPGYTSLFYRKGLDEVLEYYNHQILSRPVVPEI